MHIVKNPYIPCVIVEQLWVDGVDQESDGQEEARGQQNKRVETGMNQSRLLHLTI